MHILWITGSRIVGGAERVSFQILGELVRRGHRISALYRHSPEFEQRLRAERIEPYPARLGGSLNVLAAVAIRRALVSLRPQVALVTTSDEWVWACLVPRIRTQLVLVRHMALALPAKVRRLANARADAIIAVSETARNGLLRRPAVDPQRLHVVPNPVRWPIRDSPPSMAERTARRRFFGLPAEGKWIGFFGGTEPQKGLADILQALRLRDAVACDCRLLVCGRAASDPRQPSVEQLSAGYGFTAERVRHLGQIEDVDKAMVACDAVAIATHASLGEGAPLIALEAMACGTPVVGYALGGVSEVLGSDGQAGALATPDDPEDLARQLSRVVGDHQFADGLARAALARVRAKFALPLAADRYESLLSQLCARTRA